MLATNGAREGMPFADLVTIIESSPIVAPDAVAQALTFVRDGVITGEGPTTAGRIHYSRTIDGDDAVWCERILIGSGDLERGPVTRAEANVLFEINEAAADRRDGGRFDDLFVKAVVHHAAAASGLPVPPRAVALAADTPIESWAPTKAVGVDTEVLEWIASQTRGKRRNSQVLMSVVAMLVGAATLPLAQSLTGFVDFGM